MEKRKVTNVLIVGVGGQGTLLTSRILADVAVRMGFDVKVSEIHGMAQRGGSVVSQVRFGEKVYSPIIKKGDADLLLAFEKIEAARWLEYLKPDGRVIVNNERIDPLPVMSGKVKYPDDIVDRIKAVVANTLMVNATETAIACGNVKAANVVLLGVLTAATGLPVDKVKQAIERNVPSKALEVNLKAFKAGLELYSTVV
ncbi:MAG: indolepyruvate oxidoreductase subunit beta [Syntrophomonadaceae bacterium]|jgi:indolepyruvate ferredoxin oxidoreductase beta subunit|nr:indolepyruvate oxidoreductase subunit beta [Syntrophomonadaceae bacterium]